MIIAGIDPGVQRSAIAVAANGELQSCGWLRDYRWQLYGVDRVVIEMPDRVDGKARLSSILDLAAEVGRIEACVLHDRTATRIAPAAWKGTSVKPITHRRVWWELRPEERDRMAAGIGKSTELIEAKIIEACDRYALNRKVTGYSWAAHNILDAIGITLHAVGRL